jgi:hypothetical protein
MTFRESLAISANAKKKLIFQADLEDANSLANQPPGNETFYTLDEIAILTEDLMGISEKWRQEHRGKMLVGEKVWRSE